MVFFLRPYDRIATRYAARPIAVGIRKVDGNSVRWTYRITNGDHDEAVRQTLERWAEKEDEEE